MPSYRDVKRLLADVDRLSPSIQKAQWALAVPKFQLNGLVTINESLTPTQDLFKYTPTAVAAFMGEASPRTCESDPMEVDSTDSPGQSVMTSHHEVSYRVCIDECRSETIAEELAKKELAAAMVTGRLLFNAFWYGAPELNQFGLLNHPLSNVQQSAESVTSPPSALWADKGVNQIVGEIMACLDGFENPRIVISQAVYRAVFGKIVGEGTQCTRLGACIEKALIDEPTINYQAGNVKISKLLDSMQMFGNENAMLVYDAGALSMETSGYLWYGATNNDKYVKAIRSINNTSLIVNQTNSLKILRGI